MAWTDQCKIAFSMNARSLASKEKRPNIRKILRQLSDESGIPAETLKRWYYEKDESSVKNDTPATTHHNNNKKDLVAQEHDGKNHAPKCYMCKVAEVEKHSITQKPYGHGLCSPCRKKKTKYKNLPSKQNGNDVVCPYCDKMFRYKGE